MMFGGSEHKMSRRGYHGTDAGDVNSHDHDDHRDCEDVSIPPIGRGLEVRIGANSRREAITQQGGEEVLAMLRKTRKAPLPRGEQVTPKPRGSKPVEMVGGYADNDPPKSRDQIAEEVARQAQDAGAVDDKTYLASIPHLPGELQPLARAAYTHGLWASKPAKVRDAHEGEL